MSDTNVIVTRKLPASIETRLGELFDVTLNSEDKSLSKEELITAVGQADVFVPTVTDVIDKEVIEAAGDQLKLIASFGAGVDHIDLEAASAKGIMVTNTPSVLTEDTADMAMALILAVPRRVPEAERLIREGKWEGWSPTQLLGTRLEGKKLGILGMGRVGQAVARRARGFGLSIHYHNPKQAHESIESELEATYYESFENMLLEIDILTIHAIHTEHTHHMLSGEMLAKMKPTSYVINTARGGIIDQKALIAALQEGKIAGAGLDVFEEEPFIEPELCALENVVLLPHMSSATVEAREAMGEKVIINIMCFLDGHRPPPDRVLMEEMMDA